MLLHTSRLGIRMERSATSPRTTSRSRGGGCRSIATPPGRRATLATGAGCWPTGRHTHRLTMRSRLWWLQRGAGKTLVDLHVSARHYLILAYWALTVLLKTLFNILEAQLKNCFWCLCCMMMLMSVMFKSMIIINSQKYNTKIIKKLYAITIKISMS